MLPVTCLRLGLPVLRRLLPVTRRLLSVLWLAHLYARLLHSLCKIPTIKIIFRIVLNIDHLGGELEVAVDETIYHSATAAPATTLRGKRGGGGVGQRI